MFYSNKEDYEDKFYYNSYDFSPYEFPLWFDQNEQRQTEFSTEESEKYEIIIEKLKNIVNKKIINYQNILKNAINKWLIKAKKNNNEILEISKVDGNSFLSQKRKKKNKYKDINIIRKCKHLLLEKVLIFINSKIKKFYNNNIRKGIFIKQFKPLNQKQKSESNIKFNQDFLNKTIKDIFSNDICGKYTNFPKDHNQKLMKDLLNENDLNIKDYFTNLFNLTFFQCLEHYRGTKFYNELNGIQLFEEEINNYTDIEYIEILKYYFKNYENIVNNKKSRKSKKKE